MVSDWVERLIAERRAATLGRPRLRLPRPQRSQRSALEFEPQFESTRSAVTPVRLQGADTWAYKLQDNDVELVAACEADVFVMDPHRDGIRELFKPAEVARMKTRPSGPPKILLAYMSIGEAEEHRFYWNPAWVSKKGDSASINRTAPKWLAAQNGEGWRDNFKVRYWDPDWQKIIIGDGQFLDRIVAAGFDGVYLDIIDGFEYFVTKENRTSAPDEMVDFVVRISLAARAKQPGFLIVPQNGEELMQVPRYCDAISAIGKEDVLFDQVEHVDHNHRAIVKRRKTEIIHFTLEDLARAATNGIPVLSVEYLRDDPGNRSLIPAAAAEVRRLGYIPYFADRQLKKLHEIIAPPPADRPIA